MAVLNLHGLLQRSYTAHDIQAPPTTGNSLIHTEYSAWHDKHRCCAFHHPSTGTRAR